MNISCVLITREKQYPKLVLDRLNIGFFDEIIIETECPSVYRRYELVKERAKNDVIYVQDDDCLVNYKKLFDSYDGRITNTITEPFQRFYEPLDCTLVGWGCFFPKNMVNVFDKYIAKFGANDPHLLREADRIFTYLNRPFNTVIMRHEDLAQGEDRMSSPKNVEFHFKSAYEALEKVKTV